MSKEQLSPKPDEWDLYDVPHHIHEFNEEEVEEWQRFKGVALAALVEKYQGTLGLDAAVEHSVESVGMYEEMLLEGMISIDGAIRSIKFFAGMDEGED